MGDKIESRRRLRYLYGKSGHDGLVEKNLDYYVAFDITK